MRIFVCWIYALLISVNLYSQEDYFYAAQLIDEGKDSQAVIVLDRLIESGIYATRSRFQLMTFNAAGSAKLRLSDTAGARKCFNDAIDYYATITDPRKADHWNQQEYTNAGFQLAWLEYDAGNYHRANEVLLNVGPPGTYAEEGGMYSADTAHYCHLRARIFQKLNQPDSAFACIRRTADDRNLAAVKLDSIFDVPTNHVQHIVFVPFSLSEQPLTAKADNYLYFVAWSDKMNVQHSIWFVNWASGLPSILGEATLNVSDARNFPANCYAMSLSPDEKYLAVECYTEGSNYIQVVSFPEIIGQIKCVVKNEILAYPASVEIRGWENGELVLECDGDLTKLNKKKQLSPADLFETENVGELFLYNPETAKYSRK